jgi:5-methylthioadenosine/S-adenosylhomocysteine deaminase
MAALAAKVAAAHQKLEELNAPAKALGKAFEDAVGSFCIGLSREPYHIERYAAPYLASHGHGAHHHHGHGHDH